MHRTPKGHQYFACDVPAVALDAFAPEGSIFQVGCLEVEECSWLHGVAEFMSSNFFTDDQDYICSLFPLKWPPMPVMSPSSSPRLRRSWLDKMEVWRVACKAIDTLNKLSRGTLSGHCPSATQPASSMVLQAQQECVSSLLSEAAKFVRGRRGSHLTGGHPNW